MGTANSILTIRLRGELCVSYPTFVKLTIHVGTPPEVQISTKIEEEWPLERSIQTSSRCITPMRSELKLGCQRLCLDCCATRLLYSSTFYTLSFNNIYIDSGLA